MTAHRSIPFFNYQGVFASHKNEYLQVIQDVLQRGAFILQQDLKDFEKNVSEFLNVKYAFGVANCTDALIIALRAAGLKRGDEVIFPSHTFVATAAAIHFAGGIPVPVECGLDHLMDPLAIEPAITSKTKAIMPAQLNGRTCRMDDIEAIAKKHGLFIVEDSAQGLGSRYQGKCAGTFGLAGTFSFYPAKILGCFGDGGMIVTDNDKIAEEVELARDHGRNHEGDIVTWGLNSRLDNLQAAILNYQFKSYDETMYRRREIAARYQQNLGDLSEVKLPPPPVENADHYDVYQNYEIEAENRDSLKEFLKKMGIGTLIQWGGKAVHQYKKLGFTQSLPKTDTLFTRCLMLPMNLMLTNDDVDYISEKIRSFYKNQR